MTYDTEKILLEVFSILSSNYQVLSQSYAHLRIPSHNILCSVYDHMFKYVKLRKSFHNYLKVESSQITYMLCCNFFLYCIFKLEKFVSKL